MSIEVKLCPFHERGDQHRRLKIKHESTPRKPSSTLEKAAVSLRKTPVGIGMLFSDWYNSFFLRILLQKEHNQCCRRNGRSRESTNILDKASIPRNLFTKYHKSG